MPSYFAIAKFSEEWIAVRLDDEMTDPIVMIVMVDDDGDDDDGDDDHDG